MPTFNFTNFRFMVTINKHCINFVTCIGPYKKLNIFFLLNIAWTTVRSTMSNSNFIFQIICLIVMGYELLYLIKISNTCRMMLRNSTYNYVVRGFKKKKITNKFKIVIFGDIVTNMFCRGPESSQCGRLHPTTPLFFSPHHLIMVL